MTNAALEIVILAAGEGRRMKSSKPKVLHSLGGKSMLQRVVDTARLLDPRAIHVVVGHGEEEIRASLVAEELQWIRQQQRLGTGHAVMQALPGIDKSSTVLILCGDVPLITADSARALLDASEGSVGLLTAVVDDPSGLGRILRSAAGHVQGVVEHRDANADQRAICEINTGVIAASASDLARWLPRVGCDNDQAEYYLPDIIPLALDEGLKVTSAQPGNAFEIQGVNDRAQLSLLERVLQRHEAEDLMAAGATLADPSRIDIRGSVDVGEDVFIDVNVVFQGRVSIGEGASIGPNCVISDSVIGPGAIIHPNSVVENAEVGAACSVGPFARLRPGTRMAEEARVGNFVETKKAVIGAGSKINHLSYVGDCQMGAAVNIGAGTITCNYDGVNKHRTELGEGVFVGSNSTLVAPVKVADGGFVAAGTTLTKAVPQDALAVGRAKQRNIEQWQRPGSRDNKE